MKTVIINQARMTSTRLPGKVMRTVLGKPLLGYQIERLKRVGAAHLIVTATTTNADDDLIAGYSESLGIPVFRGSESDVLGRYHGAASAYGADVIVRVTSDCPINDPQVLDGLIKFFYAQSLDFASTGLVRTYPNGIGGAVFTMAALEAAHREARDEAEREHVTPFIIWRPERFRLAPYVQERDMSSERWCVDTIEDFQLVRQVIEALYPHKPAFSMKDVLDLLDVHPDWRGINAHIEQKKIRQSVNNPS
jgi:spore coat polysaccharide biosynthesis protein SpsF